VAFSLSGEHGGRLHLHAITDHWPRCIAWHLEGLFYHIPEHETNELVDAFIVVSEYRLLQLQHDNLLQHDLLSGIMLIPQKTDLSPWVPDTQCMYR
jgi:hypothetical protein